MTGAPAHTASLEDEILRALRRIMRRISLHSRQLARDAGLTLPQVLCLRAVADSQGQEATQVELSRALHLSSPTVVGIVDRLEQAGLLHRERSTVDRRKIYVSLTEAGRRRLQALPPPLQERFVARLQELTAQERARLLASLQRIVELMEAETIDAAPILSSEAELKPPEPNEPRRPSRPATPNEAEPKPARRVRRLSKAARR